uniref:Secreted protein n=1 Tax=Rhipicephalus zambeziensis TaxID=60191 RepID=A0A224Z1U6_9ACAR
MGHHSPLPHRTVLITRVTYILAFFFRWHKHDGGNAHKLENSSQKKAVAKELVHQLGHNSSARTSARFQAVRASRSMHGTGPKDEQTLQLTHARLLFGGRFEHGSDHKRRLLISAARREHGAASWEGGSGRKVE